MNRFHVCCPNCKQHNLKHYGLVMAFENSTYLEEIGEDLDSETEGDFYVCSDCECTFVIIADGGV